MRRPFSIRARTTAAATAAVAVVLLGGGVLTVATFAQRERSSLDRELERRARGPALRAPALRAASERRGDESALRLGIGRRRALRPPPEGPVEGPRGLLADSGSFVRVVRSTEVAEAAGDVPDGLEVPARPGFETKQAEGRSWRTLTVEAPPPLPAVGALRGPQLLQFGADLEPVEDRIGEMRTRVALIFTFGVLLAALLASVLSGYALGPLSRLRRAAAGISGTRDLSRRLPDAGAAREVDELAASVNAMLIRLERSAAETEDALETTRRFAADVGHELRTPMTSIRANLDALRRNPAMPEAERQAVLEEVASEQRQLVALLDGLQALARGDAAASLPRERVDLGEIVDAAVETARNRAPERTIELFAPDTALEVEGWADGLRLVIENLVGNAVRHGHGRVRIEVHRDKYGDRLSLTVDDEGPGLPEDEREPVFARFARGRNATAPGSGLGLALVAQQAALHGGEVEVGDSPLGGARFTVRLPAAAPRRSG